MPAQTVIKLRRGTAAQWTSANPVLAAGEIGLETDTLRTKYGNGSSSWSALSYSVADASGTSSVDWSSVLNKPSTFTPSAHATTHEFGGSDAITIAQSQVTDLTTDLAGKAATVHTHLLADITDYTPPVIPEVTFTNNLMLMGA